MELTSFYLKLNELKEYDAAKLERHESTNKEGTSHPPAEEKLNTRTVKTKQEIMTRIGLNLNEAT